VTTLLSARFTEALAYATDVHRGQLRKGTATPYVSHLLAVCSLVLEDGGSEDEAIAALLHDAVEDAGGQERLADIRKRFGDGVADIVWGCSDTDQSPKPPWRERKRRYIEHVRTASASIRRVSCADKLHNAWATLRDYRVHGETLWERFNASGDETLWYYRELIAAFREAGETGLVDELARVVDELEAERRRRGPEPRLR
jgi:GTP pyrophosphokinase